METEQAAEAGNLEAAAALLPRTMEEFERLRTTLQMLGWLGLDPAT